MSEITTVDALIAALGGASKIARVFGIHSDDVNLWAGPRGIPPGWHLRLSLWAEHFGLTIANGVFGLPQHYPADLIAD